MPLSDIPDRPENHFLVDVPAVVNPDFEQAVQEMTEADQVDPDDIIQVARNAGRHGPPREAGGKDGRRKR